MANHGAKVSRVRLLIFLGGVKPVTDAQAEIVGDIFVSAAQDRIIHGSGMEQAEAVKTVKDPAPPGILGCSPAEGGASA